VFFLPICDHIHTNQNNGKDMTKEMRTFLKYTALAIALFLVFLGLSYMSTPYAEIAEYKLLKKQAVLGNLRPRDFSHLRWLEDNYSSQRIGLFTVSWIITGFVYGFRRMIK